MAENREQYRVVLSQFDYLSGESKLQNNETRRVQEGVKKS